MPLLRMSGTRRTGLPPRNSRSSGHGNRSSRTTPHSTLLRQRRSSKTPQDGDEDLGVLGRFPCSGIPDRHGAPGVVDEEPVPRGVGVPVGRLQALGIGRVMLAEAGVGISPRLDRLPVLIQEKQEGDTLVALKLPMDLVPVRFDPGRGCRRFLLLQNLGQKCLGPRFGQGTENEFDAEGTWQWLVPTFSSLGRVGESLGHGSSATSRLASYSSGFR